MRHGARSMIRFTYRSRVKEQREINGIPIFRPEIIGEWLENVGFATCEAVVRQNMAYWISCDDLREYVLETMERVPEETIPHGSWVWDGYQRGDRFYENAQTRTRGL